MNKSSVKVFKPPQRLNKVKYIQNQSLSIQVIYPILKTFNSDKSVALKNSAEFESSWRFCHTTEFIVAFCHTAEFMVAFTWLFLRHLHDPKVFLK